MVFILVMSEEMVKKFNFELIVCLVFCFVVGVDLLYMGIGFCVVIFKVLKYVGLKFNDIDLIEFNEVFVV